MLKEQEFKYKDVTAVVIAMTNGEQPFLLETMKSVFSDPCIAQVILCIEKQNNWIESTLSTVSSDPRLEIVPVAFAPQGAIRNYALNFVRMPWVAYCDGDDMWHKGKTLQRRYASATGCDFVGADHYLTNEAGSIKAFALARYMPMTSSWMVRTEVMRQYPFDEKIPIAEDGEWWYRTEGRIKKVRYPRLILKYRVRNISLSTAEASKRRKVKIVALASIPVFGKIIYLLTGCLWLLSRDKKYIWRKAWGQRPKPGQENEKH